jgi:hypothetical protein
LTRLKWFLWHGNVFRALQTVDDLQIDLDNTEQQKLLKLVTEFGGYIRANGAWITNYGERYRNGETISSAFVESAVNQVVSKRMVKKATDALGAEGCSPAPPGANQGAQRRPGRCLPALVPQIRGSSRAKPQAGTGRVASPNFVHSRVEWAA